MTEVAPARSPTRPPLGYWPRKAMGVAVWGSGLAPHSPKTPWEA